MKMFILKNRLLQKIDSIFTQTGKWGVQRSFGKKAKVFRYKIQAMNSTKDIK